MALNQIDEDKKRKLKWIRPVGADRGIETGNMIADAYNKGGVSSAVGTFLRRVPGDIAVGAKEMLVDPINKVIDPWVSAAADIGKTAVTGEVTPTGQKSAVLGTIPTLKTINTRPDRVGNGTRVVERHMLPSMPVVNAVLKINETPNTQRDSELGKMTVVNDGDVTTYDIGGNTLSYRNSEKANQTSSVVNRLRLSNINRVGNMDVEFDPSVTPAARQRFLENPVRPTAQIERFDANQNVPRGRFFGATPLPTEQPVADSLGEMLVQGIQSRRNKALSQLANDAVTRDANIANAKSLAERNLIDRDKLEIDREGNRINELGVTAENKLRDIQGQVAQNPPVKESSLKPMVIEKPDPNDPSGMSKRQRVLIPNAEGTGYVDGTPDRQANAVPQVTPEQRSKINALVKANPNITKEIILQKIANGEI